MSIPSITTAQPPHAYAAVPIQQAGPEANPDQSTTVELDETTPAGSNWKTDTLKTAFYGALAAGVGVVVGAGPGYHLGYQAGATDSRGPGSGGSGALAPNATGLPPGATSALPTTATSTTLSPLTTGALLPESQWRALVPPPLRPTAPLFDSLEVYPLDSAEGGKPTTYIPVWMEPRLLRPLKAVFTRENLRGFPDPQPTEGRPELSSSVSDTFLDIAREAAARLAAGKTPCEAERRNGIARIENLLRKCFFPSGVVRPTEAQRFFLGEHAATVHDTLQETLREPAIPADHSAIAPSVQDDILRLLSYDSVGMASQLPDDDTYFALVTHFGDRMVPHAIDTILETARNGAPISADASREQFMNELREFLGHPLSDEATAWFERLGDRVYRRSMRALLREGYPAGGPGSC